MPDRRYAYNDISFIWDEDCPEISEEANPEMHEAMMKAAPPFCRIDLSRETGQWVERLSRVFLREACFCPVAGGVTYDEPLVGIATDYSLYYFSIVDNVKTRIDSYFASRS